MADSKLTLHLRLERKLKEEDTEAIEKLRTKLRIEEQELSEVREKHQDINRIFTNISVENRERNFQKEQILKDIEGKRVQKDQLKKKFDQVEALWKEKSQRVEDLEG